jgi:hypothetical protein
MHDRTPFQFALPNWSYGRLEFQVLSALERLPLIEGYHYLYGKVGLPRNARLHSRGLLLA